jgi:hypothetical protein
LALKEIAICENRTGNAKNNDDDFLDLFLTAFSDCWKSSFGEKIEDVRHCFSAGLARACM